MGFALRLPDLAAKPLHSDEGVNGWFTLRLHWWNYYIYRHSDYHGPFLYYWNALWFRLLGGPSEESLRMGTVVTGALLPLTLIPARRVLGALGVLVAGALLTVAPCVVYFSRTNIHEVHLIFFTGLLVAAGVRFVASPTRAWAVAMGLAAGFAFANKETALITVGALGLGAALAWALGRREAGDGRNDDPDLFGGLDRRDALRAVTVDSVAHWGFAALAFTGVIVVFFSSFFTEWSGVGGFFAAYGPWAEYGVTGRNQAKAFGYFFELMQRTEGLAMALTVPAMLWAIARRHRTGLALTGWLLSSFVVYSVIKYKTPWCVLNIDLAAFLLVGWGANQAWLAARDFGHHPLARGLALLLALSPIVALPGLWKDTHADTVERYDDDAIPYVYVQTQRGYFDLLRDAFEVAKSRPNDDGRGLATVGVDGKNPFRWYVITRGWDHERVRYLRDAPDQAAVDAAELVFATGKELYATQQLMDTQQPPWPMETYPLRPGYTVRAWFRPALWEAYLARGGPEAHSWAHPPTDAILIPPKPSDAH